MPVGSTPADKSIWYNAPVGGTNMVTLGSSFAVNRFDINGKQLCAPVTAGSSTFDGTFLVGNSTTGHMYAAIWNIYGLDVNDKMILCPYQTSVTVALTNLVLGSSGNMAFTTWFPNNTVNLLVKNISGNGHIGFGMPLHTNDKNGIWNFSIAGATPDFSGTIDLSEGQLTFGKSFALLDATFAILPVGDNSIMLSNNVSFRNITFGTNSLASGTYTTAQLNSVFGTVRFSGAGTLTTLGITGPTHPSLLFKASDLSSIREKVQFGWLHEAFIKMKANADLYMEVSTNPYPLSGPSNGYATAGRAINERVNTLALTGMILNDPSYIHKAIDICMAAIHQTTANNFNSYNEHLAVGDALHAYTVAYDWLYNDMTVQQRTDLYNEIIEFGNWLYAYSSTGTGYGSYTPTNLSCNHNAIVHGSLGMAALVTASHPEWLSIAASHIDGYFKYSTDDTGYNYEGLGYYGYGSLGAVPFSTAYKKAGYSDLIAAYPKNFLIPEWILRFVQPWGSKVVALNDSPERLGVSGGMMQLISQNYDGVGLWTWLKMYGPDGDKTYGGPIGGYIGDGCTIPYVILFADPSLQPVSPKNAGLPLGKFFIRGSGSFRSSWQDDAALATFTCGFDQHRGHNHRDENSFTFSAFGKYFVIDPGYEPSETRCHNTVLVNGTGQAYETNEYDVCGTMLDRKDFRPAWYMKGDATAAYRDFLGLDHATRKFLFVEAPQPYIIVSDDITKNSTADFTWLLHTKTNNVITMGSSAGEFYIRGPETTSAVCFVKFLNPVQGLTVTETNLTGQTFISRDTTYYYTKFFKEIQAAYSGINPKFTAILIAAKSTNDLPVVETVQSASNLILNISFLDGREDLVTVTDTNMNYIRLTDTFYLHADMPVGSAPTNGALWFDELVSGDSQKQLNTPFYGSRFDLNGKLLRSGTTSGSQTFDGTFVVGNSTMGLLYAASWNIYGMDVSNAMMMRAAGAYTNTVTISNLAMGASGNMFFRTLTNVNNTVNLSVGKMSGSGQVGFGNSFSLSDATLSINSSENNRLVLANDVSFGRVTFGTNVLDSGTYTANQLNGIFGTTRFSGSGTMTGE